MFEQVWFQPAIILVVATLLAIPFSKYLIKILDGNYKPLPLLSVIEGKLASQPQSWQQYLVAMMVFSTFVFIFSYFVLLLQPYLPLNPDHKTLLSPTTILHSAMSFLTTTDLQHYVGEKNLSNFSQIFFGITNLFIGPAIGISIAVAMIRALRGDSDLGNFFIDIWRSIIYILLPCALLLSIVNIQQGTPMTFKTNYNVQTLEQESSSNTEFKQQNIVVGPVAAFTSIKMLGSNGGGFYNMNSSHPYENPTFISNTINSIAMMLLPCALVFMYGTMLSQKRHSYMIFAVMMLGIILTIWWVAYFDSLSPNPAMTSHHAKIYKDLHIGTINEGLSIPQVIGLPVTQNMGNLEGKEMRFSGISSATFLAISANLGCGSINAELDSLNPIASFPLLLGMWINCFFGGIGVGLVNMITYIILGIFLAGMMVGRTPEYFGKKVGAKEIKLIIVSMLFKPLLILLPLGLFAATPLGMDATSNPGAHGFTQMLYQFSSAAANNGGSFNGLKVIYGFFNNPNPASQAIAWDLTTAMIIIFSRYLPIIASIAMAATLGAKRASPYNEGSLRIDTLTFAFILIGTLIIIGAMIFIPLAALGPVAEQLGPIPFGD